MKPFHAPRWWLPALLSVGLILGGCQGDGGTKPPPATPPIAKLEPGTLDFGRVTLGETADRSFTISNTGGGTLSGSVSGICPEFIIVSGEGAYALDAGEALQVTIRFQPSSAGSKICPIAIGDSSGTVTCSGVGEALPTGACCDPSGTCAVTTQAACTTPGIWQGATTICSPNPCPQPAGACCDPSGTCTVTTQTACASPDTWQGATTICSPNPCPQPTGACCAQGGVCSVTTQAACAAPGTWQGASTTCSPNPCQQPTGACCAQDGVCSVTTQAACAASATWQGAGTTCSPNPCPQPTGACCALDGVCSVTTQAACAAPSTWQGAGTICSPNPCQQPTGACCDPSGTCAVTTQAACYPPSTWQGSGTACSPNPCQQPTGACCTQGGACSVTTQAACAEPGTWQGAGTTCSPNPCPQPAGACCAQDGVCSATTQAACAAPTTWQGAGTTCAPNPCQQPTGACCTQDGGCSVMTQAGCAAPGTWQGASTTCSPNPCPQPTGACCAQDGVCSVTTQAACAAPATWQGADTTCSPNPCQQPIGVCCTQDGVCSATTQAACTAPSTWQGSGTTCSPNPCPQPTGACCTQDGVCSVTTQASCTAPSTWQGSGTTCSPNPCPSTIAVATQGFGCGTDGVASLYRNKLPAWGDLHSHTRFSYDAASIELCTVDPAAALETARLMSLDFVTITDHAENGSPGQYTKAKWDSMMTEAEAFQDQNALPIIFPGFEYTKSDGHTGTGHRNIVCRDFEHVPVRGFGFDTFERPTELWAFLNQSPAAGNYMCIPHHPAKGGDYDNPNIPLWMDWSESFITATLQPLVEVYSRHGSSEFAGCEEPVNLFQADHSVEHALGLWLTTKNPGYKFGLLGGTDTHYGNPGDVTENPSNVDPRLGPYTGGVTAAWVSTKARDAIWSALWAKDCYATSGARIALEFTAKMGDALVPMGGTLPHSAAFAAGAAAQVNLHVRAVGANHAAITRIQIFRDGVLIADESSPAWGETVHLDVQDLLEEDDAYYRAKVWDSELDLGAQGERAWSSPIWVERN